MILDAQWDFAFDDLDRGIKEKWFTGLIKQHVINVPFSYQTQMSGIHVQAYHPVVWYQKIVQLKNLKTTLIHIEKSDYETDLWINGMHISNEAGGYHRITADISNALVEGDNLIVVRVKDTWDTQQPRGKQRWKKESFDCWYVETTGIYQSVWLEFVDTTYVKKSILEPRNENYMVDVTYEIAGWMEHHIFEIMIMYDDHIIACHKEKLKSAQGTCSISIKSHVDKFKLLTWNDQHPHFYDIIFTIKDGEKLLDEAKSYVTMRSWKANNRTLYLNDEPVYLKMILDQGYWPESGLTAPSIEDLINELILIKKMGFNGIRKHQKIEDERFYYYADLLGIYVWLEMPSAYEFSDLMMERMTDEWFKIVKQHRHYGSIMAYVLFNESWGIPHVSTNQNEQSFTSSLYHLTKSLDPSRFVISNDGWEHTLSDIITIHNYVSEGIQLTEMYDDLIGLLNGNRVIKTKVRDIFAQGYHDQGQPIVFSEYGGVAFIQDVGWGYGNKVDSKEAFKLRLTHLTQAIIQNQHISGYCLTQFTDVEQEVNGLLTPQREPKLGFDDYQKINEVIL